MKRNSNLYINDIIENIGLIEDSDYIIEKAPVFLNKSKDILAKINEEDVNEIREKIKEFLFI